MQELVKTASIWKVVELEVFCLGSYQRLLIRTIEYIFAVGKAVFIPVDLGSFYGRLIFLNK